MGTEYKQIQQEAAPQEPAASGAVQGMTNRLPNSNSARIAMLKSGQIAPTAADKGRRVDMPDAVRTKMENSFGMDFSGVKLYESQLVGDLGDGAMARGNEIAFAPGRLDFSSQSGQALLGHELSHVAKQARGEVRGSGFLLDHGLEALADREGAMAARGETIYGGGYGGAVAPLSSASAAPMAGPMQAGDKRTDDEKSASRLAKLQKNRQTKGRLSEKDSNEYESLMARASSDKDMLAAIYRIRNQKQKKYMGKQEAAERKGKETRYNSPDRYDSVLNELQKRNDTTDFKKMRREVKNKLDKDDAYHETERKYNLTEKGKAEEAAEDDKMMKAALAFQKMKRENANPKSEAYKTAQEDYNDYVKKAGLGIWQNKTYDRLKESRYDIRHDYDTNNPNKIEKDEKKRQDNYTDMKALWEDVHKDYRYNSDYGKKRKGGGYQLIPDEERKVISPVQRPKDMAEDDSDSYLAKLRNPDEVEKGTVSEFDFKDNPQNKDMAPINVGKMLDYLNTSGKQEMIKDPSIYQTDATFKDMKSIADPERQQAAQSTKDNLAKEYQLFPSSMSMMNEYAENPVNISGLDPARQVPEFSGPTGRGMSTKDIETYYSNILAPQSKDLVEKPNMSDEEKKDLQGKRNEASKKFDVGVFTAKEAYYRRLKYLEQTYGTLGNQLHPEDFLRMFGKTYEMDTHFIQDSQQLIDNGGSRYFDFENNEQDKDFKRLQTYFISVSNRLNSYITAIQTTDKDIYDVSDEDVPKVFANLDTGYNKEGKAQHGEMDYYLTGQDDEAIKGPKLAAEQYDSYVQGLKNRIDKDRMTGKYLDYLDNKDNKKKKQE